MCALKRLAAQVGLKGRQDSQNHGFKFLHPFVSTSQDLDRAFGLASSAMQLKSTEMGELLQERGRRLGSGGGRAGRHMRGIRKRCFMEQVLKFLRWSDCLVVEASGLLIGGFGVQ